MIVLVVLDVAITLYLVVLARQLVARQQLIVEAFEKKLKMRVQVKGGGRRDQARRRIRAGSAR